MKWKGRPKGFSYDKDVAFLKKQSLYSDKGYKYGSEWLAQKLPKDVEKQIKGLF